MTFKHAKSLTIVSAIVIICVIILFAFFRTDKATRTAIEQHQAERAISQADQEANQSESTEETGTILGFRLISSQDISFSDEHRMMYWIALDVNEIPSEADILATGKSIWKDGNTFWKEFTVFVYLPEMQTDRTAYAVFEFGPDGLVKFQINEDTTQGTKWE